MGESKKWTVQNNFLYKYKVTVTDKEGKSTTHRCFHAKDIIKKFPGEKLNRSTIYRIKNNRYVGDKYKHISIEPIRERRPATFKVRRVYEFQDS
jgi:hypothetical protein